MLQTDIKNGDLRASVFCCFYTKPLLLYLLIIVLSTNCSSIYQLYT